MDNVFWTIINSLVRVNCWSYGLKVGANVYGGAAYNFPSSSVTYNTVNIYGGTIRGEYSDTNNIYATITEAPPDESGGNEAMENTKSIAETKAVTTTFINSVKGNSGMLELGWQVKPGNGPLTLDLGLNGWVGQQRGGSVRLGATWSL